jgi:nucleoid DNA-binding protein
VNISPFIRELLLHREEITIPGFGTFTISHHSAEVNKVTKSVSPPSKEILFNERKHNDDGQLAEFIMQKQQLSKEEAIKSITLFVKSTEDQLRLNGTTSIEGIGYLGRDKAGKYIFKPMKELIGRINIFELPKLDIPAAKAVTPRTITPKPYIPPVSINTEKKRRWWIPAALVALLIGLASLVYFTGLYKRFASHEPVAIVSSEDSSQDDRLVFGNRVSTESDTMQERISRELDKRTAREEALVYQEAREKTAENFEKDVIQPVQPVISVPDKSYHIIAGAFQVEANAKRQKAQLENKGFSPVLLDKRGKYYMVSLGSYDTKEQAVIALKQFRGKLEQEMWVMRVK